MNYNDTVWLTQDQMANLFERERSVITKHINSAIKDDEINEKSNVQKMHIANSDKPVKFYDLDVIISVGYRVKSPKGVVFRKWASKVLKEYLVAGYVENEKRLEQLEKRIKVIDIASRLDNKALTEEAESILNVLLSYNKSLQMLDDYDHKKIAKPTGIESDKKITYKECIIL